jgi:DNA-binding winged helix-turn-helix (wHTH) protein
MLRLFAENAGRLMSRDTIMQTVWPDVTVVEEGIFQCVHDIRRALGDQSKRLLRAVPRRGYIFIAAVQSCPDRQVERAISHALNTEAVHIRLLDGRC